MTPAAACGEFMSCQGSGCVCVEEVLGECMRTVEGGGQGLGSALVEHGCGVGAVGQGGWRGVEECWARSQ